MAIIKNIDQLKETVKISSNIGWELCQVFLNDAQDKYLVYYLGAELVERLENIDETSTSDADTPYLVILPRVRRTLGPFAEALGTHERSINVGDTGHTVRRSEDLTPASDRKIDKFNENLYERAWSNLEYLLAFLEVNNHLFPEWKDSSYYKNSRSYFFSSAQEFQETALIDINRSRITFEKLRQLVISIELFEVKKLITDNLYDSILSELADADKENIRKKLLGYIRAFIGARVGELQTSQATRAQRSAHGIKVEHQPLIRPIFEDLGSSGSYYKLTADTTKENIIALLPDMGIALTSGKMEFNSEERKIMNAEG